MAPLKIIDACGSLQHLDMSGSGTELDPYRPVQDVYIQDQTTPDISLFLAQHLATDLSFTVAPTADQEALIQITSPTLAPVVGNFVCIKEGTYFTQIEITAVALVGGDDYTISVAMPMDYPYTTAAIVCLQNVNMNVDGSGTPIEFSISPGGLNNDQDWDITRVIVAMTHTTAGDDGTFGGIPALTKGVYMRYMDGVTKNLFNAKENSDFAIEGFDVVYSIRSTGGGTFGTRSRITFNGQEKRGVVIRLCASELDKLLAVVREDLDVAGLLSFRIKAQGQVVDP